MAIISVNTDGGGDYISLVEAIAALPATFTEDVIIECAGETAENWTSGQTWYNAFDTTANYKLHIRPATGQWHSGTYDTGKYRITRESLGGGTAALTCQVRNITIEGIQMYVGGTPSSSASAIFNNNALDNASGTRIFSRMLIVRAASPLGTAGINGINNGHYSVTLDVRNSIFWRLDGSGIRRSDGNIRAYNNTMHACGRGIGDATTAVTARNNRATSSSIVDFGGAAYNSASSNNLSSDTSAPGTDSIISATSVYTDASAGDLSLAAGDPGINQGADLSASMDSVDAIGTVRPQSTAWDIGAFEFAGSVRPAGQLVTTKYHDIA